MGNLTYLIIILVVINVVGRLLRALQKSAAQQKQGPQPAQQAKSEPKSPFAVLEERLKELGELDKRKAPGEESSSDTYAFETAGDSVPEVKSAETAEDFARETAKIPEGVFEEKPREQVPQERFPFEMPEREYIAPERPVTSAPGPIPERPATYRRDIIGMLRDTEGLRSAILVSTVLGPPRSKKRFRTSWGAER
ncbi:MAG: hypothetical protein KAX13_02030 [Candidatus Krumholzibacteria bacterium]|nr:hypothetical protein [Candidatus Krumholzibacteria bacterium]